MAAPVHNASRRALLGAAASVVVAPLPFVGKIGGGAAAPPPPFGRSPSPARAGEELIWSRALAGFRAAEAEVRGFEEAGRGLGFAAAEARQAGYDALCEAMEGALGRLLAAPAPDVAALAVKIGLVARHESVPLESCEDCLEALERDALLLARVEA